jgi:hypothetical protein
LRHVSAAAKTKAVATIDSPVQKECRARKFSARHSFESGLVT